MDEFNFVAASALSREELVQAFNHAFEGYLFSMTHTVESLTAMFKTNDIMLDDSLILRSAAGENIGVALLAIREERGWVAGMAVAPEWRGQHAGTHLMQELLVHAHARKLRSIQLEVLVANDPAYRLYQRLGFHMIRPLLVYGSTLDPTSLAQHAQLPGEIVSITAETALLNFEQTHPVAPPWQREGRSLSQMQPPLHGIVLPGRSGADTLAYLLALPAGIGQAVMDIGSRAPNAEERKEHGIALLRHLMASTPEAPVRAINVPAGDPLGDALAAMGCAVINQQYEMRLDL